MHKHIQFTVSTLISPHSLLHYPKSKEQAPAVVWINVFSLGLGPFLIRAGCALDKSVALWSLAAALKPRDLRPCLEKALCPQSYFLQEQSFFPSVSFSLTLPLCVFLFPARSFSFGKTSGESAANRVVTVNSLFVLLHRGRRGGFLTL